MQANQHEAVDALLDASRALVAVSARSIADSTSMTLPQFRMLVVLTDGPRRLVDLAAALDVVPSTAARMVDRLEEAGLVDRSIPPENRRETRLALTPAGKRIVTKISNRRRRDLTAVVERLTEEQTAELTRSMRLFADIAAELWS
ncbi:MarR family transcriptional regulator [Nocardioides mangrovicus]|uniref:MarR family transcriptional regulator n=1 Tax=Nocardioides mangrovicus TaxID=2478913 RepID=A0A3L8P2Q0_9ACTN|nr:MarR family transcriptional regulator [Nocardioides mangrovicus]RLV49575.1 MarR family transcriptional regulator [Nocardioides mangrovicus]